MVQDTSQIKNKILSVINSNGPSLPVHIAREIGSSILFTSAFLSELVSEGKLKISSMRVGSSPIYFLSGQEPLLSKFADHLKSKEKEVYILLKEKKFLKDSEQAPPIRVALREIKDFAIPFETPEGIIWRFFTVPEEDFSIGKEKPKIEEELINSKPEETRNKPEKDLGIFEQKNKKEITKKQKKSQKKKIKKKSPGKNEKFFEEIKNFINKNPLEMKDIIGFSKNEISILVSSSEGDKLLFAVNKKRIDEKDIAKANNKASELGLSYILLSKGGPLKKIENLIKDLKNLSSLESFEPKL